MYNKLKLKIMKKLLLILMVLITYVGVFAQQYELDNSYITGTGFNGEVYAMEFDGNGKLLVGGDFTDYNGIAVSYLVRLNADGTLDGTFTPALTAVVNDLTIHSGNAVTVVTAGALKRFLADGTTDVTFVPVSLNGPVYTIDAESTGYKVVIGGWFNSIGNYNNILRLTSDGNIDPIFISNTQGFSQQVRAVEITNSGKIIVGGDFQTFNYPVSGGVTRNFICQLNSDGSLDASFNPGLTTIDQINKKVFSVAGQADGKVLGGTFYAGIARLARCNTNGTKDFYGSTSKVGLVYDIYTNGTDDIIAAGSFEGGIGKWTYGSGVYTSIVKGNGIEGATKEVNAFTVQADGAIIIGGDFTSYNGFTAGNFARINPCGVSFSSHGTNSSICEGIDTSFIINATGSGTLSYQWQVNTNNTNGTGLYVDISNDATYSNVTTATLSISSAPVSMDKYYYRCVITDANCISTSDPKILFVNPLQVITADPVDITVCENEQAIFSISFTGSAGSWQWQEDAGTGTFLDLVQGAPYNNVNGSILYINNPPFSMNGYKYRLVSTNCNQNLVSAEAILTVNELPLITNQPTNQSICVSGDANFDVSTSIGSGTITYQWQYKNASNVYVNLPNTGVYAGVTTPNLQITGTDNTLTELFFTDGAGVPYAQYRCVVSANGCDVNTITQQLYIYSSPTITTDPSDLTVCGGGNYRTFSVATNYGSSVPSYQWQVDDGSGFADITPSALYTQVNTATLKLITPTSALTDNLYRCEVGGCASPVYSAAARLVIDDTPSIYRQPTTARVCDGVDTSFSVGVTGTNLIYQWQRRPLSGGVWANLVDNATYVGTNSDWMQVIAPTQSLNGDRYKCVITSENGVCVVQTNEYRIYVETPPSMTQQYVSRNICEGQNTSFRVNVANWNNTLYTRQWQVKPKGAIIFTDLVNGTDYSGVMYTTLNVLAASSALDSAKYRCVITGCVNEIYSPEVDLYLNILPVVTQDPQPKSVCVGSTVTFSAFATGTDVTYQWQYDQGIGSWINVTIAGTSNFNYTPFNFSITKNGYKYRCKIKSANPCTQIVYTAAAEVSVMGIIYQPVSISSTCKGDTISFSVNALNATSYQWLESGNPISNGGVYSGVTTDSLVLSGVDNALNGSSYQCVVTGVCGSITSSYANLSTVLGGPKPIINVNGGTDLNQNPNITLYANYGGTNYEWYLDGVLVSGSSSSLALTQQGAYTLVIIQNGCRSEESDPVIITGIENYAIIQNLKIYPNPVTSQLNVVSTTSLKIERVEMLDVTGKVVKNITQNFTKIDVSSLQRGVYFVKIYTDKGVGNQRIIKD